MRRKLLGTATKVSRVTMEGVVIFLAVMFGAVGTAFGATPVANDDSYSINLNTRLVVAVPGVLDNDTDADSDLLKAALQTDVHNGTLDLLENGSFTYTPNTGFLGLDNFTYKADDGNSSSQPATVRITVFTCDANAGLDKDLTCVVTQVNLSGSSSTPGATFSWVASAGGNIVSGANTATPLVNAAGTYTLTVTDPANGCTATDVALVTSDVTPPNADAGLDKELNCTVTQINLAGSSSTGGATFAWVASAGGHIVSGATTATPLVDAAGTYTLTVTNPAKSCTATDVALVTANVTPPNANAGPDKELNCTVTQINLAGSSSTGGATFAWVASAGGHIVSGGTTATPLVDAAGTYTLTVTDPANGCTATDVALVTSDVTPPNANAGPDKVLDCAVTQVNLAGSSSTPGATFSWVASAGGNIVSGANTATPLVNAAGTYTLTVTNPANGCTASDVALVTSDVTPPNVNAGSDKVLTCTVTQINLSGSSSTPGATFSWVASAGGNIVSGANTATPLVDAAGTYTLTVTNPANGCTATDVALVTANVTPPNADAGPDKELTCAVTQINLSGSSTTPGATFSWVASAGGKIVSGANTATPLVEAAGTYTLTVTYPTNGCTASDVALVTVDASKPVLSCAGDQLTGDSLMATASVTSTPSVGVSYVWSPAPVSGQGTPFARYDTTGSKKVLVTFLATGCSNSCEAVITGTPVARDTSLTTNEDTPASLGHLPASDPDAGQALTFAVLSGPDSGRVTEFNQSTGAFKYTPALNYNGLDSLKFIVCDNDSPVLCNTGTVRITVTPVNDAPVAVADTYSTNEDAVLTVDSAHGVLSNDTDVESDSFKAGILTGPSHGTVDLNPDGSFTYTPDLNNNEDDSFTYRARDVSASQPGTVTITVHPVNDPPVAVNDSFTTNRNTTLVVVAPGVLVNDTDVDGDALTAEKVTGPSHGTLTLISDGAFEYIPNGGYKGPDGFTYQAKDAVLLSNIATVTITITGNTLQPVAVNDSYSTPEDTPLNVPLPGVLSNDTSRTGNPLTADPVANPSHGAVTLNPNGSFTYTPDTNYNGLDAFTYRARDAASYSNVATVTITVNPVNDKPVARDDHYDAIVGATLTVRAPGVLKNDEDVDGDHLRAFPVAGPYHASYFVLLEDGSFTYVTSAATALEDRFTYRTVDPVLSSDTATVVITVHVEKYPPIIDAIPIQSAFRGQTFVRIHLKDVVSDKDTPDSLILWTKSGAPDLIDSIQDRVLTVNPPSTIWAGTNTLTLIAEDRDGLRDTAQVTYTVREPDFTLSGTDFGTANADCAGDPSALTKGPQNVILTNKENVAIKVTGISPLISGEFTFDALGTGRDVPGKGTMTFAARYCPSGSGTDAASVKILYAAVVQPLGTQTAEKLFAELGETLRGIGVCASMSTSAADTGNVQSGESVTIRVPVRNTSPVILRINSASVSDQLPPGRFTVQTPVPFSIGPRDESKTINVTLSATEDDVGRLEAALQIGSNAACANDVRSVTLLGFATPKRWKLVDKALFLVSQSCSTYVDTIGLQNINKDEYKLVIDTVILSDQRFTAQRIGTKRAVAYWEGGDEAKFQLTFSPNGAVGSFVGSIKIKDHAEGSPNTDLTEIDSAAAGDAFRPVYFRSIPSRDTTEIHDSIATGSTWTQKIEVENSGGAPLRLRLCQQPDFTSRFDVTGGCQRTLLPDSSAAISITGTFAQPDTFTVDWSITAERSSGSCNDSVVDNMRLTLMVQDRTGPSFPILPSNSVGVGDADTLRFGVTDNVSVSNAWAWVRPTNSVVSDTGRRVPGRSNQRKGDTTFYKVPAADQVIADGVGYEYKLFASDGFNVDTTVWFRRDIRFKDSTYWRPSAEVGTLSRDGKWYMIAAPGRLNDSSVSSVLKVGADLSDMNTGTDGSGDEWRVYEVNPDSGTAGADEYRGPARKVFIPGRAFWFRHVRQGNDAPFAWFLREGSIRPDTSNIARDYSIPLAKGWNMFSNPFLFDVFIKLNASRLPFGTSAILRGSPGGYANNGKQISSSDPRQVGVIEQGQFDGVPYAKLKPWAGYAVKATGDGALLLEPHPPTGSWVPLAADAKSGPGLALHLSAAQTQIGEIVCGFGESSQDSWDGSDSPLFPLPQAAGALYVVHDDWGVLSDRYVVDRRAASAIFGATYQLGWRTSQPDGEMRLAVSALDELPVGATAFLYDRATDKRIELSAGTSYTFRSGLSRDDNRFVVLIGDAGFTEQWTTQEQSARPVTYQLAPNYPNPFNAGTVIGFTLPQYTHVSLDVFNILGQRVRALVDQPMYPGVHQIEFDARDNAGRGMAAGVYFYRLKTDLGTQTHKMVLLK